MKENPLSLKAVTAKSCCFFYCNLEIQLLLCKVVEFVFFTKGAKQLVYVAAKEKEHVRKEQSYCKLCHHHQKFCKFQCGLTIENR